MNKYSIVYEENNALKSIGLYESKNIKCAANMAFEDLANSIDLTSNSKKNYIIFNIAKVKNNEIVPEYHKFIGTRIKIENNTKNNNKNNNKNNIKNNPTNIKYKNIISPYQHYIDNIYVNKNSI